LFKRFKKLALLALETIYLKYTVVVLGSKTGRHVFGRLDFAIRYSYMQQIGLLQF